MYESDSPMHGSGKSGRRIAAPWTYIRSRTIESKGALNEKDLGKSEDSPRRRTNHQELPATPSAEADEQPFEQMTQDEKLLQAVDQLTQYLDNSQQQEGYEQDRRDLLHEEQTQSWDSKSTVSASDVENLITDGMRKMREYRSTRDMIRQSEAESKMLFEISASYLSAALDMSSHLLPSHHPKASPDKKGRYYAPGFLGGYYVQANPDTGASHDMISESYAAANNYHIDPSGAGPADLPGGRKALILGTVTLPFRFENDTKEYLRIFQVMRGLSYSCILGKAFLKLTKTLSVTQNRLDRIRQVAKRITSRIPRLHLIGGTHERLQGTLNGHQLCALPDTGADVNVICSDLARWLGLKIRSDRSHRKLLELGDGSVVRTLGTVYNAQWSFGPHGSTGPLACEFQVLDDIPCDIILSNDFLFDNSVFELYEHYFYDASLIEQLETCAQLNCITEVPLPEQELDEMMMDVYARGNEEDRIAGIPRMELPRVERVRFRLSRPRFSRIFTGNALPTGTEGNTPSPGGTALDPALPPISTSPQQPKRRWIARVVRLVIRRSDHKASLSASPSSVP